MIFAFGEFEFDDERMRLCRQGEVVKIERIGGCVLSLLLQHAGSVVTREQMVAEIWKRESLGRSTVTAAITKLRKILRSADGRIEYIETLYGYGYRFISTLTVRRLPSPDSVGAVVDRPSAVTSWPLGRKPPPGGRAETAVLEAARGHGRLCALMGAPGAGKTRVAEAIANSVGDGPARASWVFCHLLGDTPFSLWRWIVRSVLSSPLERGRPATAEPHGAPSASWDACTYQSFEWFIRAVVRSASKDLRVLIIEDLHRADAASLELLARVVEEIARCRLLIVATVPLPPGSAAPRADTCLPYLLGHRNCERIFLPGSARLVRAVSTNEADDRRGW